MQLQSKKISGSPSRKGDEKGVYVSQAVTARLQAGGAAFVILGAVTFCHLLNDVMQALLPSIYPMLKSSFSLSFGQIGLLTLIFQVTASLLQLRKTVFKPSRRRRAGQWRQQTAPRPRRAFVGSSLHAAPFPLRAWRKVTTRTPFRSL